MTVLAEPRFLVKVSGALWAGGARSLFASSATPLFPDEAIATLGGSSPAAQWYLYPGKPDTLRHEHPWDAAYDLARSLTQDPRTLEGAVDVYVEPDLTHRRFVQAPDAVPGPHSVTGGWPASGGLNKHFPPTIKDK